MFDDKQLSLKEILWNALIFYAVAFTAAEVAYSFVFSKSIHTWQLWTDGILSLIFTIDLALYIKKESEERSGSIAKVFKNRNNQFWFFILIDIVATIPFDIISYSFSFTSGIKVFSVLRLLRLFRIKKIIAIYSNLTVIPQWVRVKIMMVSALIAVHWIACGWVLVYPPENMSHTDYYVRCLYWAITTLTTIGYGDITPTDNVGRLYTMVIMITGVGVYGVVIGKVTQMFAAGDKHKEQTKEKLADLALFLKHYQIPKKLQKACFGYYQHLYGNKMGENDDKIISDLPQALQAELKTYMNVKLISGLPVFNKCSSACLKEVARNLEQIFFTPGQPIIQTGDIGEEMFIIAHGETEVLVGEEKTRVATLKDGQFFGEAALLEETTRNADVRALNYCDLYKLNKSDFLNIIKKFPELMKNMEDQIQSRQSSKKAS